MLRNYARNSKIREIEVMATCMVASAACLAAAGCLEPMPPGNPDNALATHLDGGDELPAAGDDPAVDPTAACNFDYDFTYNQEWYPVPEPMSRWSWDAEWPLPEEEQAWQTTEVQEIVHAEPLPTHLVWQPLHAGRSGEGLVLPGYRDNMPLFERGVAWEEGEQRCYQTPHRVELLDEAQAYDLYAQIATLTTGVPVNSNPGRRSVVGVRGAHPGTFVFHGNWPDRFNDTLALFWIDETGAKRVLEFAANTDTGAYNFGYNSSSSLRPNRHYRYTCDWHRTYNALRMAEYGYEVRDDGNHNGHWDSDRNGWFPSLNGVQDAARTGAGHNIHAADRGSPLGSAPVGVYSAGCQVIPGIANWTAFITAAWTRLGDGVDYFLVDVRDIDRRVWIDCAPDGTRQCPYEIAGFPFEDTRDTRATESRQLNRYSCSSADEGGPEVVYFFTVATSGTLNVSLDDVAGDDVDMDVHLLDGDDPRACLARGNLSLSTTIAPGRYFIVVDTWVDDAGTEKRGPYTLTASFR